MLVHFRAPHLVRRARRGLSVIACFFAATLGGGQTTWTTVPSGTNVNLWGVCYGGGRFVAVGEGGTILTSPDGNNWTRRTSGTTAWLTSVAYGLNQYLAVGDGGILLLSTDTVTWENLTVRESNPPTDRLNVAAFVGNGFQVYGDYNRAITVALPPRIDWLGRPHRVDGTWWRGFAASPDLYVLGGQTGLAVFGSNDPFMVNPRPAVVPAEIREISGLIYDHGTFTAVGSGGAVLTSSDALTWASQPSGTTQNLQAIVAFNDTLVAAGENGIILSQDQNNAWQPRNTPTHEILLAGAANDAAAIIVGGGGTILRSTATPATPVFATQPAGVTETIGGAASFAVRARGSLPMSYQWFRNGVALAGETRATLIRAPLTASDAADYSVAVTNSAGTATSNRATLRLLPPPAAVVDSTFRADPALEGTPNTLLALPDGSLLVATGNPHRLVKLRPDGALDPTWARNEFRADINAGGPSFRALALQPDGRILVGGSFNALNGESRLNLVRLNADGTTDSTFAPSAEATVRAIAAVAIQRDGRILVANGGTTPLRLLADGRNDSEFRPEPLAPVPLAGFPPPSGLRPWTVRSVAETVDGKIFVGFQVDLTVTLIGGFHGDTMVMRLNSDGSADPSFTSRRLTENFFVSMATVVDNGLVMATRQQSGSYRAWRFTASGADLPGYAMPTLPFSSGIFVYPDGRVLYTGAAQTSPVRLTSLGLPDPTFTGGVGSPAAITALPDGHVAVAGDFELYDGKPSHRVARLNSVPNETPNAPTILGFEADKMVVDYGETVTLRVWVSGSAELTYDWAGVPPQSGTGSAAQTNVPMVSFTPTPPGQTRRVWVVVRNNRGVATSSPLDLMIRPAPPIIAAQPSRVSAPLGREALLSVSINPSAGSCLFDWQRNGQPLATSTLYEQHQATWRIPRVSFADVGTYTVTARNAAGDMVTSAPIELAIDPTSRFANLSTRAMVGADQSMIAGFVITGQEVRNVLIRGIGPGLARLGISNPLPDPQLRLFDTRGNPRAYDTDDDWAGLDLAATFTSVGAFPLETGSKDAAFVATLVPGSYTVQLSAKSGQSGVGLIEIYEADAVAERMINLSTRATVVANQSAICGFSIYGPSAKRVLVRAAGPSLAVFGVGGALANPRLQVRNAAGAAVAANDDWSSGSDANTLSATMSAAGAFPFTVGSRDAALLLTLDPGNYTAIIEGGDGASGVVLVEVYEVP